MDRLGARVMVAYQRSAASAALRLRGGPEGVALADALLAAVERARAGPGVHFSSAGAGDDAVDMSGCGGAVGGDGGGGDGAAEGETKEEGATLRESKEDGDDGTWAAGAEEAEEVEVERWLPLWGEDVGPAHMHVPKPSAQPLGKVYGSGTHKRFDSSGYGTPTPTNSNNNNSYCGARPDSYCGNRQDRYMTTTTPPLRGNSNSNNNSNSYSNNNSSNNTDYFGDRHESGRPPAPGAVGLQNLGNTCFMNRWVPILLPYITPLSNPPI